MNKEIWTIESWKEFREALEDMKPRSKLFETIKQEMTKRGHWKNAPRGVWAKKDDTSS